VGDSNIRGDRTVGIKRQLKRLLIPRLLRQCTGILPCGSLGRDYFLRYGAKLDCIWYMPYEPDYDMIAAITREEVDATYRKFGLSRDRRYLLYCGRLAPVKRVDLLLASFSEIAANRPNWDVLIVGDGPLRATLSELLPANLRSRCHWVGFQNDQNLVARLQRGADVCVLPSDYEPWGVIINEAVASGMAVVASDMVGAAAELVRDRVNGRLFPNGNREALTSALLDVTDEVNLRRYQTNAAGVLAEWRRVADPVAGLAAALESASVDARSSLST
jgi:glycosyltransferase involved in cell wall biosynthesis